MRVMALTLLVLLGCAMGAWAVAPADMEPGATARWSAISGSAGFRSQGTGDPQNEAGATISIDSMATARAPFGGAIASLELARYRGQELELSALIEVLEGHGTAAVWARADAEGRRPAFVTSAAQPVRMGAAENRQIRLYVPEDSKNLVLGAIVQGEARARITRLRVKVLEPSKSLVSAYDVLEAAFALVEEHALNAPKTDLAALRQAALTAELRRTHSLGAYARLAQLLDALGDKHSFALPPAEAEVRRRTGTPTDRLEFRLIGRAGYLKVPGFMGTAAQDASRFAREICMAVTQLAPDASAGWVVDLRRNTGGNMWPMLSGLTPILGTDSYGAFRDRDGRDTRWAIEKTEGCGLEADRKVRVAVLLGPQTASSGEAVAVAFSGRPNTRSFGLATAGKSTSNVSLTLPDGGALFLTHGVDVDRAGKAFPAGVTPDVTVGQKGQEDEALAAALAWLGSSRG